MSHCLEYRLIINSSLFSHNAEHSFPSTNRLFCPVLSCSPWIMRHRMSTTWFWRWKILIVWATRPQICQWALLQWWSLLWTRMKLHISGRTPYRSWSLSLWFLGHYWKTILPMTLIILTWGMKQQHHKKRHNCVFENAR